MAVNCPGFCRHFLGGNWKKNSGKIFVFVYLLVTLVTTAVIVWEMLRVSNDQTIYFWFVAGLSVQVAVAISLWNIFNHLVYYVVPDHQKYIVRILGLVPAHSINCWFAIRYIESAIYLDTIRNFYQAVVVYSFMSYLLAYLNDKYDDIETVLKQKPKLKPTPPCCCVKAIPSRRLLARLRFGVLNYVIVHPTVTIIAIITEVTGQYVEGSLAGLWMWLSIIDAISQVWAMYCLLTFYRATREELAGIQPVGKLITIQLTIFGSFFQSLTVFLVIGAVNPSVNPELGFSDVTDFSRFVLDFIICIEMSLSAAAHLYTFPYTDYKANSMPQNFCKSCISCCSIADMAHDAVVHVKRMMFKKTPNLVDHIEYDDHDEPEVELEDMAVVHEDKTATTNVEHLDTISHEQVVIGSQRVMYHHQQDERKAVTNEKVQTTEELDKQSMSKDDIAVVGSVADHQQGGKFQVIIGNDGNNTPTDNLEGTLHNSGSFSASGDNCIGDGDNEQQLCVTMTTTVVAGPANALGETLTGSSKGEIDSGEGEQANTLGTSRTGESTAINQSQGTANLGMLNMASIDGLPSAIYSQSSSC